MSDKELFSSKSLSVTEGRCCPCSDDEAYRYCECFCLCHTCTHQSAHDELERWRGIFDKGAILP